MNAIVYLDPSSSGRASHLYNQLLAKVYRGNMPCCIAILQFIQCRHNALFKIECTSTPPCNSLCDLTEQETLLVTQYQWSCEECHTRKWTEREEKRTAVWDERVRKMEDEEDDSKELAEHRERVIDGIRLREAYEEKYVFEPARLKQVEEIQWVEDWTIQYGKVLWEIKYNREKDKIFTARRKKYLLNAKVWDLTVLKDSSKQAASDASQAPEKGSEQA